MGPVGATVMTMLIRTAPQHRFALHRRRCSSSRHLGNRVRDGHQQQRLTIRAVVYRSQFAFGEVHAVEPPNTVSAPSTVTTSSPSSTT
ncbi:Uncharacterised protein [Mycobacterium tuberculosis]|nr:Uncharacterised protein [Mycobacterium tuberculosis]